MTGWVLFLFAAHAGATIQLPLDSVKLKTENPPVYPVFDSAHFLLTGKTAMPADFIAPAHPRNDAKDQYVQQYLRSNDYELGKIKQRSVSYFPLMDSVFSKAGIPMELKYLAVVESRLMNKVVSGAGARGIWQLMPVTARTMKLRVTAQTDERLHLYKSTQAAARYLKDLHKKFDDWLLTIAAYNSGPGPVLKAIRISGSRDFWKLQHLLPAETRNHVKKFISIHYYFEGMGGVTTLTRAETNTYMQQVTLAIAQYQLQATEAIAKNNTPNGNGNETGLLTKGSRDLVLTDEDPFDMPRQK